MSNSSRPIITRSTWVIIIISLCIGLYLYWFYTHFDRVIEEIDNGPVKEAKANPFYAAEKFLEKTGKKAESRKNYADLDKELDTIDTLVIESSRVGLSQTRRDNIKNWVNEGGHLILLATELYDYELETSRDVFLDDLGIRLYDNYDDYWSEDEDLRLTKVTFEGTDEITSIDFNQTFYIQDSEGEASYVGGNESSDFFAQYNIGDGMVTVVTDMGIWKNYAIENYDHAMFLYQLAGDGENVWFLYNTIQPSMSSVMIEIIPMVIVSFLIFIIAILFSAGWRKGPPKSDELRVQRGIMLHVQAAGEFSYRNDQGLTLLRGLMRSLESKLRISIHQYSRLEEKEKIVKLSQLTGLKTDKIALLWNDEEMTHETFMEKVLLIQEIKTLI